MLNNESRSWLAGSVWFAAVALIAAAALALGARASSIALLVPLCAAPLGVAWLIRQQTESPTLAQVVHAVNVTKAGRS